MTQLRTVRRAAILRELAGLGATVTGAARLVGMHYQNVAVIAQRFSFKFPRKTRPEPLFCACGNHAFAPATKGFLVLVSPDDAPLLNRAWRAHVSKRGYVTILSSNGGDTILARAVTKAPTGKVADHKDGNTTDNRRSNLRVCTHAENCRNKRSHREARAA